MSITLSGLRDRVETMLADAANVKWSTTQLDEAIRGALEQYSLHLPYETSTSLTLSSAGRKVNITSLSHRHVTRVVFPYDASDPAYPPNDVAFSMWSHNEVLLHCDDDPQAGQVMHIWYTTQHTLNGLDDATATTFWEGHATLVARGAAAHAVMNRCAELAEMATVGHFTGRELNGWALERLMAYGDALRRIKRKQAATVSGIAPMASLDRWDARGEG